MKTFEEMNKRINTMRTDCEKRSLDMEKELEERQKELDQLKDEQRQCAEKNQVKEYGRLTHEIGMREVILEKLKKDFGEVQAGNVIPSSELMTMRDEIVKYANGRMCEKYEDILKHLTVIVKDVEEMKTIACEYNNTGSELVDIADKWSAIDPLSKRTSFFSFSYVRMVIPESIQNMVSNAYHSPMMTIKHKLETYNFL